MREKYKSCGMRAARCRNFLSKFYVVKDLWRKTGPGLVHHPRTRGAHTLASANVRLDGLPNSIR
jgi:hypothetical protein